MKFQLKNRIPVRNALPDRIFNYPFQELDWELKYSLSGLKRMQHVKRIKNNNTERVNPIKQNFLK